MGRKGLKLGNKKSVVAFGISAWNMQIPNITKEMLSGQYGLTTAIGHVINNVNADPVKTLGPAAVGYWFWGKPYRGKL